MNWLLLNIAVDSDDDVRALYQALLRALAEARSDVSRTKRLRGSGYGNDSWDADQRRAEMRVRMLGRLVDEVGDEMQVEGVEPW